MAAAEDVDLVVLEGMGRAIETNLYASFSCDSLKLAMVKHPEVRIRQTQSSETLLLYCMKDCYAKARSHKYASSLLL